MHALRGDAGHAIVAFPFGRRDLPPNDILMEALYTGICHTDYDRTKDEITLSEVERIPVVRSVPIGALYLDRRQWPFTALNSALTQLLVHPAPPNP